MKPGYALVIVAFIAVVGAYLAGFDFNEIAYGLGADRPPPTVEMTNPNDFPVLVIRGSIENPADEDFERFAGRGGLFSLIPENSTLNFPSSTEGEIGGAQCARETGVLRFLRIVDETGLEFEDPYTVRNIEPSNFEVFFTLGPGYCFENRRGDSYTIGEPFLTINDVG